MLVIEPIMNIAMLGIEPITNNAIIGIELEGADIHSMLAESYGDPSIPRIVNEEGKIIDPIIGNQTLHVPDFVEIPQ
jgi:hypothetical protein